MCVCVRVCVCVCVSRKSNQKGRTNAPAPALALRAGNRRNSNNNNNNNNNNSNNNKNRWFERERNVANEATTTTTATTTKLRTRREYLSSALRPMPHRSQSFTTRHPHRSSVLRSFPCNGPFEAKPSCFFQKKNVNPKQQINGMSSDYLSAIFPHGRKGSRVSFCFCFVFVLFCFVFAGVLHLSHEYLPGIVSVSLLNVILWFLFLVVNQNKWTTNGSAFLRWFNSEESSACSVDGVNERFLTNTLACTLLLLENIQSATWRRTSGFGFLSKSIDTLLRKMIDYLSNSGFLVSLWFSLVWKSEESSALLADGGYERFLCKWTSADEDSHQKEDAIER